MTIFSSTIYGIRGSNVLTAMLLAASLVSADTVINLLLGDSSIGESDIRLRGKVVGSIIAVVR